MLTVFLFPRSEKIDADDGEVSFESQMGPFAIKTRFTLKDMTYQGKLEL